MSNVSFHRTLLGVQFFFSLQRMEDHVIPDASVCGNFIRSYRVTVGANDQYVSFHYTSIPFEGSYKLRVMSAFILFITDSIEGRTEEGLMRKYNTMLSSQLSDLSVSMKLRYDFILHRFGQPEELLQAVTEAYNEMIIEENLSLLKSRRV